MHKGINIFVNQDNKYTLKKADTDTKVNFIVFFWILLFLSQLFFYFYFLRCCFASSSAHFQLILFPSSLLLFFSFLLVFLASFLRYGVSLCFPGWTSHGLTWSCLSLHTAGATSTWHLANRHFERGGSFFSSFVTCLQWQCWLIHPIHYYYMLSILLSVWLVFPSTPLLWDVLFLRPVLTM